MNDLTARERQALKYICKGWSNSEVGAALGISRRTAEDHRQHIFKKYRVRNVVELVRTVYDIPEEAAG